MEQGDTHLWPLRTLTHHTVGTPQRTQAWLENYVFKRCAPPFNQPFTYFVSSVWHGFYPG